MAQIYDPNQAGAFNKALQSGLSTANAAAQAGITDTKDFALGTNGNLGGLIPGANAAPATGQATFQSVDFAQTFSGQPAQGTQLAMNAAQVQEFRAVPGNETIPFTQNADGPPGDLVPYIVVTGTERPPTTTPGAVGPLSPLPTIEIQPRPVTGLDLTVPGQLVQVPGELGRGTAAPEVVTAEQLGSQTFPLTPTPTLAPGPEPTIYSNIQAPGEQGRGTAAPGPVPNESSAETARLAAAGNADPNNYVETFAPPPVQADDATGVDQQVAANTARDAENQSNAESARLNNANQQAAIQSTYKQPGNTEWRFRISLGENADYLYKTPKSPDNSNRAGGEGGTGSGPGILEPLAGTNGVIFPYTPTVQMTYRAKYNSYELVHSNYRGAFYQNSSVDDISIRGTFTAQDTNEAAYVLAVIHFFRSVTKMFYGQDKQRGAPPPLVYLSGLGDYQFNNHPAVVTSFDYSLPADVDYIRATSPNNFGTDLLNRRTSYAAPPSNPLAGIANRLGLSGLFPGATPIKPSPQPVTNSVTNTANATYVPTKIEISLNLMPMQTRDQVSKQFSLAKFADGNLLRGGFW